MSDLGSAKTPLSPNAFVLPSGPASPGNSPHFPNAPIAPAVHASKLQSSKQTVSPAVVEQIGSLESLLHQEIEQDQASACRIGLTVIASGGGALASGFGATWEELGIDVELILITDGANRSPISGLGKRTTLKFVQVPHRLRSVGAWHVVQHACGDLVAVLSEGVPRESLNDWLRWMAPLQTGLADVVYVSRILDADASDLRWYDPTRWGRWIHNSCTGFGLTDVAAPIKIFRRSVLMQLAPRERGAFVEMEVLARLAQAKVRVAEVASQGTMAPRPNLGSWSHLGSAIKYSAVSRWMR